MIASAPGTIKAPPAPWIARAAISCPGPAAKADHAEAAPNSATPRA